MNNHYICRIFEERVDNQNHYMNIIVLAFTLMAVVFSCKTERETAVVRMPDEYAFVTIPVPDFSVISLNGEEVLNLYKFTADQVSGIYWPHAFGDRRLGGCFGLREEVHLSVRRLQAGSREPPLGADSGRHRFPV
jgi:hypothetical protein